MQEPDIESIAIETVPYKLSECSWCGKEFRHPSHFCSKECLDKMQAAAAQV